MDGDGKRLGRALLALRLRHNLSQEELAVRADKAPSYISRFERGAYNNPAYSTLNDLALAFGLPDAGVLMQRLEHIDRSNSDPDPEVERIRDLAAALARQLQSVSSSQADAILSETLQILGGPGAVARGNDRAKQTA